MTGGLDWATYEDTRDISGLTADASEVPRTVLLSTVRSRAQDWTTTATPCRCSSLVLDTAAAIKSGERPGTLTMAANQSVSFLYRSKHWLKHASWPSDPLPSAMLGSNTTPRMPRCS